MHLTACSCKWSLSGTVLLSLSEKKDQHINSRFSLVITCCISSGMSRYTFSNRTYTIEPIQILLKWHLKLTLNLQKRYRVEESEFVRQCLVYKVQSGKNTTCAGRHEIFTSAWPIFSSHIAYSLDDKTVNFRFQVSSNHQKCLHALNASTLEGQPLTVMSNGLVTQTIYLPGIRK